MRHICNIFLVCAAVFTASCNGNTEKAAETSTAVTVTKAPAGPAQSKLTEAGTQELMGLVTKYYGLKNALVATKEGDVNAAAVQLSAAAESMQAVIQKDSVNKSALQPFADTVAAQTKLVIAMKDPSCEQQRLAFGTISRAMYSLLKNADLKSAKVYHEYCPMAFNDKGATWLSDDAEIKNPYFGKKMLECGEVTDSL